MLRCQRDAEIVADTCVIRNRAQRDCEVLGRFVRTIFFEQGIRQVVVRVGIVALQCQRMTVGCDRFVDMAGRPLQDAQIVIRRGVVGLQFDGLLVVRGRLLNVSVGLQSGRRGSSP